MSPSSWGIAFGPLASLLIFGVFAQAIKLAIARYMRDGWLKRAILKERWKSKYSAANSRLAEEAARYPQGWRHFIKRKPITVQAIPLPSDKKSPEEQKK